MKMFVRSLALATCAFTVAISSTAETPAGSHSATPLLTREIDGTKLVTLRGNVRPDLAAGQDLGPVDDSMQLRLTLVLRRSPEQQIALDNLVARQQQPTAPEYHQWLTPQQFGERFGVAEQDILQIRQWIEGQAMHVDGVMNNGSFLIFTATARDVRQVFHTQLHSFSIDGGKYPALVADPQIPAALALVVSGIQGLNKIPHRNHHTPIHQTSYDATTHQWHSAEPETGAQLRPHENSGGGEYDETPLDFYTIYNVNKLITAGYTGKGTTVAVPEPTDMHYGTVTASTGVATGGDVATFRKMFGVPGTLNMHVYHGYGTVPCNDPGITDAGSAGEATLDAEWSNALAPGANLVFMSCDSTVNNGVDSAIAALIDNNLADAIGISWGESELVATSALFAANDTIFKQAAAQGQTVFVAAGDAGSDTNDQDTAGTATSGFNIDAYSANPLITSAGGLDFSDTFDAQEGGPAQSTYWGATNTASFSDAKGYVPETTWNGSCASSLIAALNSSTPAAYCGMGTSTNWVTGSVVGGAGGYSTHYAQPSYQPGIPGLSTAATKRATPDIALFASNGIWQHAIVDCDSDATTTNCSSQSTIGAAGGTSYVAPQLNGIAALLVNYTGSRQGFWNPALYALAKAQFTAAATKTACYANGQTANAGVTKGLPAAACIFNDVTTSNNDVPCAKGTKDCYVETGASYGLLSTSGAAALTVAFPSGIGYDLSSGLGSINVYNLFTSWYKAFATTTGLAASPTAITTAQSTKLTATVKGVTPTGFTGETPALTGSVSFALGATALGSCTISGGTCSLTVAGTALKAGANSITATFSGNKSYPASTSTIVTVTVTALAPAITLTPTTVTFPNTVAGVTSAAQTITVKNTGTATANLSSITLTGTSASSYLELNDCGATLAAAASCVVTVAFKPASAGVLAASLSVADNAAGSPQTAALSGTGTAKPTVTLSTTSLTFASTVENTTSEYQTVTVTNAGTSVLDIASITIAGTNPSQFTQLSTCGPTLAPAANCVIFVAFKPTVTGALAGTLTINDNGSATPQTVKLTGTGAA